MSTITFLSDYGHGSDYVGICHAVIARVAPGTSVIDLAHDVPAGDIRAGAHLLNRAVPYSEPGVHLAVVDPGVGGQRRALALGSAAGRVFVGPDNGLLTGAVIRDGGVEWAREISSSAYRVKPVSQTFHGRDIFAPVAAALAAGTAPEDVGEALDPKDIVGPPPRSTVRDGRELRTPVVWIDRFGNVTLEATWEEVAGTGLAAAETLSEHAVNVKCRRREAVASAGAVPFGAVEPGALLLHADSFGTAEIAMRDDSAADELDARPGAEITLRPRR